MIFFLSFSLLFGVGGSAADCDCSTPWTVHFDSFSGVEDKHNRVVYATKRSKAVVLV